MESIPDRTNELSFDKVDDNAVNTLLAVGVVVMKNVVSAEGLSGIATAYKQSRRLALPRRLTARAIAVAGAGDSALYNTIKAKPVESRLPGFPLHMRSARQALTEVNQLHGQLFEHPAIQQRYPGAVDLNQAAFPINVGSEAFPLHQDTQGVSGLGYAVQPTRTRWQIHEVMDRKPGPISFTFDTEPGDTTVLLERQGPEPKQMQAEQGYYDMAPDGSLPHSGINLEARNRYGIGLFHLDYIEEVL